MPSSHLPVQKRRTPPVNKLLTSLRQVLAGEVARSNGTAPALNLRVRCAECGELIPTRIDKANDLLSEYADSAPDSEGIPHPTGYLLRKEMVGRHCQNLVHLEMRFDDHRRITRHEITGGELVSWEDTE
jgi:hypothetical protein